MSDELNMSSVTADPAPETAGKRAAPEEKPPKTPGKRAGLIIGIAAAVLVLAYAGCCVAANAVFPHGVSQHLRAGHGYVRPVGAGGRAALDGAGECPAGRHDHPPDP